MLNCKQGDLAVIVRSMAGNEGKIVRCLRLVFDPSHYFDGPRWLIDREVPHSTRGTVRTIADCALRPLRDNEGEDETLRLVGRPVDSEARGSWRLGKPLAQQVAFVFEPGNAG